MDFDSKLLDIQRRVNSLHKEHGSLIETKFSADQLAAILQKWAPVIGKCDDHVKRKVHLYLVLNTQFTALSGQATASDAVAHVANTTQTLGADLLVALIRGCDLLPYAFETISFSDPALATEYFQKFLEYNQLLSAGESLAETITLLKSLFNLLISYERDLTSSEFKSNIVGKLQNVILTTVGSIPDNLLKKMEVSTGDDKLEIAGLLAKHLMELVISFVRLMEQPEQDKNQFYLRDMLVGFEYGNWPQTEGDSVKTCFERIVEECEKNMKSVDLDIWMSWDDVRGECEGKSLQVEIGETAFRCTEISTEKYPILAELVAVLSGFKRKPVSEIEMASLESILDCLKDDKKASKEWLLALLEKEGSLLQDGVSALVEKRSHLWDVDVVGALLTHLSGIRQSEQLARLALTAFRSQDMPEQSQLLKSRIINHGAGPGFKLKDFDTQVTTVLNRSASMQSGKDTWLPQLLALCLQSPKELLERAIISGIGSRGQGTLIAAALLELEFLCGLPCGETSLLVSALQSAVVHIEPATSHLSHLVLQLEEHNLLKTADFLIHCLLPALKADLAEYKIPRLLLWIQLLKRLLRLDAPQLVDLGSKVSLAVLLAVLAEILQRASWVLGKFRHSESMLRAETVLLVRPLACKYANSISNPEDKKLLWLRAGLLRLTSHNRAHFGAIWTHFALPVPSMNMGSLLLSREAMHQQSGMPPGGPDQLLSPLLILLPSCCTPEWRLLTCSLAKVLSTYNTTDQEVGEAEERDEVKLLPEAIRLLVTALMLQALMLSQQQPPDDANYSNECALACLENSVRNLGIVMKEEWLPKLTDASEVENGAAVVRQVALLLRSLPTAIASSCSLALSGVLQQAHEVLLVQAGVQTDLATWCAQELALSLALLPDRESRQALARKLLIEPAVAHI